MKTVLFIRLAKLQIIPSIIIIIIIGVSLSEMLTTLWNYFVIDIQIINARLLYLFRNLQNTTFEVRIEKIIRPWF